MLKKRLRLFLGLVVLAGSACVTPTHASSASLVVISYIQAAGQGGAKDELVTIHNNGPTPVDITNWCLVNKASILFACLTPPPSTVLPNQDTLTQVAILPPYSSFSIASRDYVSRQADAKPFTGLVYDSTNQSSGSIVNSADSIALLDSTGDVIDQKVWSSAPPSGKAHARMHLTEIPLIYASTQSSVDWTITSWLPYLVTTGSVWQEYIVAYNPADDEGDEPTVVTDPQHTEVPKLRLTELLANASGADAGKEFIELHNPSASQPVSTSRYGLRVGSGTFKLYTLPDATIPPMGYLFITDEQGGFTLANTQSSVQLYYDDIAIGELVAYSAPKDDQAWALINDTWQYTSIPTPGFANEPSVSVALGETVDTMSVQAPCASNQFRNPETGRCKLVAAASVPTPCKAGQERNPETGRCRAVVVATTPAACKEGQERNPDTNRCRTVPRMTTAAGGVKGVQEVASAQLAWYYWAAIAGVIGLIVTYGVWEWRQELRTIAATLWAKVVKR